MDEVYTLEDSVERQMSPETTKKKKKKKRMASLLEDEQAKETRKNESADSNSSLMPSRELEEVVTMNTIGDAANEVFVSDNQVGTKTVLPCTHIKPRLPSSNSNESIFGDYSNTGHSSCGNSKDGYEDSSSPSAKALSIALQAPFFHRVDHAHQSPLRTEDEHSVSRESEDTKDSKGIDDPVSKRTSDFRMVKFSTRNLSRVSVCDNGNRKNVQIGSAEELTQTRHPEFIIEVSRGTVKEDCLLYCTDGEERIDRTESTNGSNISQGKTNPYDVHARDLNNLEEKNQNTSAEALNLELCGILEAAYCSETSVPFTARDIRLVDNETISLNQENNVKHDKEESERVVAETNSPLTLLKCFESQESAKREEKRLESIECVPLSSKRVDDFVGPVSTEGTVDVSPCVIEHELGLSSVDKISGAVEITAEKGNTEDAVLVQEKYVFTDENFQRRNITHTFQSLIHLESEITDLENVSRDARTDLTGQTSTRTETGGSLELDSLDSLDKAKGKKIEKGNPAVIFTENERSAVDVASERSERTENNSALRSARVFSANGEILETTSQAICRRDCQVNDTTFTSQSVCVTTTTETTKDIKAFSSSSSPICSVRDFQLKGCIYRTNSNSASETDSILQNAMEKVTQLEPFYKAEEDEFPESPENLCNCTSSTKNSKGDLISPATCDVASTAEDKIDRETGTVFNATSEYRKIDHLTYRGKVPSLQCGAKPFADEQRKEEKGVSIPKETNKSKEVQGDDKEEGEITSEEEGASETQRQSEKGREEGELSSSDSDLEVALDASSQGTQKTARCKSKVSEGECELRRIKKDLCSTRRQSSTELRQKSSKEKSRKPGNSGCDGGASLSSTKNSDLRTKLGQIRKKRSILVCGSPDSGTHGRLRGTQSAENQGNLEKVKQDGFKAVNQTSKKEVTLSGSSQTKRRQTGKHLRGSGSSAGCNPVSNGQRNHVRGKEEIKKERKSISLQDDDDRTKNKVRHTNSRRKTEGRSHNSQLKSNKTAPNSSPESKFKENGGNSRSFESHKPKVKAKESTVTRGSPILKNIYIKEDKKLAKDSETLEQKMKTKACSQVSDSKRLPKHVRMQDPKSRDSNGKRAHRNNDVVNHLSDSSDERSLGRPLESDTKAVVSTHAKCNSGSDKHGRKMASSRVLSSQPKEQSKSASNLKVRDESKRMIANAVKQRNDNRKGELKQAKTTVKVSPRKASRKIAKNVIANFTSKTKVQLERGETGSTRKRRTSNDTELHHAKKLRREPEEKGRSKLPMEASKFEIPLSNLKRGENDIKSGYTDNSQKSIDGLHSPQLKTVIIGRNKCLVFKHRHINQLFLRGDNVVMVAYAK